MTRQWLAVVRRLIEYGEISKELTSKLEKLQRTFCAAVLKIHGNAASVGLRAELGLQSSAPSKGAQARLLALFVLCRARSATFPCLQEEACGVSEWGPGARFSDLRSIRHTLRSVALGWSWTCWEEKDGWSREVRRLASTVGTEEERAAILERSSLRVFVSLGQSSDSGPAKYLDDMSNREGTRLMTNARLGTVEDVDHSSCTVLLLTRVKCA